MPKDVPWVDEFLRTQRFATIATIQRSGHPHLSPMGYLWDGKSAILTTTKPTAKYRNLMRSPLATLHVADAALGRWVSLEGRAVVTDQDIREPIVSILMKGSPDRAQAERRADRLIATQQRVVISITPSRVIAWERPA